MKSSEVDLTIKKIFKYIFIFLLLCIFVYSLSGGMIVVNAKTYTIDKEHDLAYTITWTNAMYGGYIEYTPFGTPQSFDFSTVEVESPENLMYISLSAFFKDMTDISIIKNGNYIGYMSFHFKYYYDVKEEKNFTFKKIYDEYKFPTYMKYSIYDYKLYTSINDDGKYSYDEFIILSTPFPYLGMNETTLSYSISPYFATSPKKVPNLNSTMEVYDAILTDDGTLPMSIEEYISNSGNDYYDPEFMPYEDYDDDDGFFSKLFDSIATGFGSSIGSGTGLWSKINVFLKKLFLPSSPFFKIKYTEMEVLFNQKFGIFTAPINIFINFIEKFLTLSSENTSNFVIKVPEYTVPGFNTPILKATTYDLSNVLNHGAINKLWILYLDFVDCFLIISFLNLSWNKLSSFLGGMTSDNTYYSVDDIDTYDKSTGELISSRQRVRTTQQSKRRNY